MTLAATYALTDTVFSDALTQALGQANAVIVTQEVLATADNLVFTAQEGNWQAAPPPVILINGVIPTPAPTIARASGTVTFASAQSATALVTASFTFTPFPAAGVTTALQTAFFDIESRLATTLDDTGVPRGLLPVIVTRAYVLCLRSLMSPTAEYYSYSIDGRKVDKNQVTVHYDKIILRQTQDLNERLTYLGVQYMDNGGSVLLNIDRGRLPDPYSRWQGGA